MAGHFGIGTEQVGRREGQMQGEGVTAMADEHRQDDGTPADHDTIAIPRRDARLKDKVKLVWRM